MMRTLILGNRELPIWAGDIDNYHFCDVNINNDDIAVHDFIIRLFHESRDFDKIIYDIDNLGHALALRIAMHIRLSLEDLRQFTCLPFLFVSFFDIESYLKHGECSQIILSKSGCYFCRPEQVKSQLGVQKSINFKQYKSHFLDNIHILPDDEIGNHSIANQWGAEVLNRFVCKEDIIQNEVILKERKRLYYKYILANTANLNDYFVKKSNTSVNRVDRFANSEGKKILVIDDQVSEGWGEVLKHYFKKAARFEVIEEIVPDYDSLSEVSKDLIDKNDWDLFFLDLRMNGTKEEGNLDPSAFSGMNILNHIKELNKGNQVIMFTASNKVWNLRALLDAGADGYYVKESPEFKFPESVSLKNFNAFENNINHCLNRYYLRNMYTKIGILEKIDTVWQPDDVSMIIKQLDLSLLLITKAREEAEFAYAYISLYAVVEMIAKLYIEEYKRFLFFKIDNSQVENWKIGKKRVYSDGDDAKSGFFSIAQRICAIYMQMGNGIEYGFANDIDILNKRRNTFIHNLPLKTNEYDFTDIFTSKPFEDLFDVICVIFNDLSKIEYI